MIKPNIDILVPVHNQPMFAIKCVQSLRQQSRLNRILVMDDGSDEETQEALKNLDDVTVYRNVGAEGFVRSNNRLAKKSDAPYILFLNSDTEALPHAIEYMAQNLDDGAAVCGALLIYPQNHPYPQWRGRVQHAGVQFEVSGYPIHFCAQRIATAPAVQKWRSINAVTGACLMIKREVWDKIGGFDPKFGTGVFEDVSLCLSVKRLGLEVVYEPKAVLTHFEHASQTQADNWFSQQNLERNFSYLCAKHGVQQCDDDLYYRIR